MKITKEARRRRIRSQPLPELWQRILEDSVPLYRRLPADDRRELTAHLQILLEEKHFEGAAGLDVTERMRLIVAAQAAVLLLHRPTDFFPKLVSILLYPGEYAVSEDVETDDGVIAHIDESRAGEFWQAGVLVLSWEDVEHDLADRDQNVVLHEFAHQLDAEDGEMNGAPVLTDQGLRDRWAIAMSDAFEGLAVAADHERETLLDPYGAEDPAEFFAVATEAFFLLPIELECAEPKLYDVLRDFFLQDPTRW